MSLVIDSVIDKYQRLTKCSFFQKQKKVCGHFMETRNKCLTSVATDFISQK